MGYPHESLVRGGRNISQEKNDTREWGHSPYASLEKALGLSAEAGENSHRGNVTENTQ